MLRAQNMEKYFTGVATHTLTADADESFRVRRLIILAGTGDEQLTFSVDRVSVQNWRVADYGMWSLGCPITGYTGNLFDDLTALGLPMAIPVACGQTFQVTFTSADSKGLIVYDLYDKDDVQSTEVNGTDGAELLYVNRGQNSSAIASGATGIIDQTMIGAEFPNFPFTGICPSRYEIDMYGIVATPVGIGAAGAQAGRTGYIKMIRDREVLFDTARNGLLWYGPDYTTPAYRYQVGFSTIGGYYGGVGYEHPLIFPEPIKFRSGDELLTYVTDVTTGVDGLAANKVEVGYILRARRI